VTVRDKDAILLGGYITTTSERSKNGVPVLQNIPGLGNLFSSRRRTGSRTELMVLMRPTILHTPADAALVADIERQRLPGVKVAEREFDINEQTELRKADRQIERTERSLQRRR
jgi:general secretion pathway protein D